jgi:hypothetical protein
MDVEMNGDAGATTWEVLDRIRDEVTECLISKPARIDEAESLTANALWLLKDGEG